MPVECFDKRFSTMDLNWNWKCTRARSLLLLFQFISRCRKKNQVRTKIVRFFVCRFQALIARANTIIHSMFSIFLVVVFCCCCCFPKRISFFKIVYIHFIGTCFSTYFCVIEVFSSMSFIVVAYSIYSCYGIAHRNDQKKNNNNNSNYANDGLLLFL